MEKDNLIQEAAGENNGLKEEIRALLSQRDDLNAENAKLSAQLHGYRNDLNQVLAMKDSQHKQILAAQVERISVLERQKEELEIHIRALEKDGAQGKVLPVEQEILSQASEGSVKHDAPGAEVEKLREQLQAARNQITTLEETLELEREAQATHSKELKELKWESGILRTESETAEERVAELARDLLMMEQQLLEEREAAAQLRSQNQSFGQAMASLQDARDQAFGESKELRLQLDEINRTGHSPSPPGGSKGEVWSLKNALSALQNDRERMVRTLLLFFSIIKCVCFRILHDLIVCNLKMTLFLSWNSCDCSVLNWIDLDRVNCPGFLRFLRKRRERQGTERSSLQS